MEVLPVCLFIGFVALISAEVESPKEVSINFACLLHSVKIQKTSTLVKWQKDDEFFNCITQLDAHYLIRPLVKYVYIYIGHML